MKTKLSNSSPASQIQVPQSALPVLISWLPVHCRHMPCTAYLLEQGADAFAVDKAQRRSAIHYAVLGPQPDVLRFLVSDDAKIHTEDGIVPLRDVRVHDMSGQCR